MPNMGEHDNTVPIEGEDGIVRAGYASRSRHKKRVEVALLALVVGCDGAATSLRGAKRRGNPGDLGQRRRGVHLKNRLRPVAPGSPRRRCAAPRDDGAAPFGPTANAISAVEVVLIFSILRVR
jgi:hypothetical protein